MELTFLGGAKLVTGANYLLEGKGIKILVECGMFQGSKFCEDLNYEDFSYDPQKIDFLLITHAHVDHIGRLPKLYRDGFRGKVISTKATRDLASLILMDTHKIIEEESLRHNRPPFFTEEDVEKCLGLFDTVEYGQEVKLKENYKCRFLDAAHILGSSIIEFWYNEGQNKITFSGDLGNSPNPLIGENDFVDQTDYLLIESAYGDRNHEERETRKLELERTIEDTVARGGVLMIPAFAMERTQEILYYLNELIENRRVPKVPIFIDSPLAIKITYIYKNYTKYFSKEAKELIGKGDKLFNFPGLKFTMSSGESKTINEVPAPKIIIAGSGMSMGGRILFHEQRYLSDPKSCILFSGFQVKSTRGRKIQDGAKSVNIFGQKVKVKAQVKVISGFSDHADQNQLVNFVDSIKRPIKKVYAVQGEEKASKALVQRIKDELGIPAEVPKHGLSVKL